MAREGIRGLLALASLIAVVFSVALIVGVLEIAIANVNTSLVASSFSAVKSSTASSNAVNYNALAVLAPVNSLAISWSGRTFPINSSNPIIVAITGNSVKTYATSAAGAIPGPLETQTFSVTSASPTTLTSTTGNFYNISSVDLSPTNQHFYPSVTGTVAETFNSYTTGVTNTITGTGLITVSLGTPVSNFNTVVAVIQIVLPFIGVIAIVVAAKVILDVFGFGNIFALGKKGREEREE